ncbi:hypothetical protein LTR78_009127 [Recurvomyces mirabilis]|uniref:Uncharacterized protein n=1 Tax=Recurvomyces mirabilis TaxID=574656 RepID=A0AAE0TPD0_9PEZI|nr:hypothetical protein LTR78_009127 [Recurvomyces mirabilis]KAK5161064.1 hypothetical protein LTS14_000860 [Recurvomyces mirabilis]
MSLQPTNRPIDRENTAPFLLRVFWKQNREHIASDFSVAPPADTSGISDYSSLLPSQIRQQNTRAEVREGGRGKWIDKPLGNVVIGGNEAQMNGDDEDADANTHNLEGDSTKSLGDARFVIGDYVVCSIYTPGQDGRVAPLPPPSRGGAPFGGRGPPPPRENGFSGGYGGGRGGGGFRGGYAGGRGGAFGAAPPMGDWRRGERPPPPSSGYGGGYGRGRGGDRQF